VRILGLIVLALAAGVAALAALGSFRWRAGTRALRERLDAARAPVEPRVVDFRELEGLPAPVQRYFRRVLKDGQPVVAGVRVKHSGSFNIDEKASRWKPFTSDQRVVTRRRGFDWDGRVAMMPGLRVHVHDAFVAGEGTLQASFLGVFPLVNLRGTEEVAEGELMRYFAETVWFPTALLPGQGVRWKGVDDRSARGVLVDGAITVSMLFTFNEQDLIDTVRADARGRTVGGQVVPTPWHGRFWNYAERGGMRVPLDGEVAWVLPEGPKPYWRGRIKEIAYEPVE
jgi:hypothetical protein